MYVPLAIIPTDSFMKKQASPPKKAKPEKVKAEDIKAYIASRNALEAHLLDAILDKARLHKRISTVASSLAGIAIIGATVVFLRSSQPAPDWLWVVNSETGVPERISTVIEQDSLGERQDRYWAQTFVRHYEQYEYNTIQQDWDAVGLMATPNVASKYREKVMTGANALLDSLGQRWQIKVNIRSTIVDTRSGIATVRFSTTRHNVRDNYDEAPRHWIARFGYDYRNIPARESEREINPFGYNVQGYEVIPETN